MDRATPTGGFLLAKPTAVEPRVGIGQQSTAFFAEVGVLSRVRLVVAPMLTPTVDSDELGYDSFLFFYMSHDRDGENRMSADFDFYESESPHSN